MKEPKRFQQSSKKSKTTCLDTEEAGRISNSVLKKMGKKHVLVIFSPESSHWGESQFYYCPSRTGGGRGGAGHGFLLLSAEDESEKQLLLSFRPNDWALARIS